MRNDIHRDSKFVPADYDYIFSYAAPGPQLDHGFNFALLMACMTGQPQTEPLYDVVNGFLVISGYREVQPIADLVGKFFTQRRTQCDVCGARYRYGDVWQHRATGEAITIGHECADKYGALADRSALAAYRKRQAEIRKLGRERVFRREKLREFLTTADMELRLALRTDHEIVRDIRRKLIQWGSISEKQAALVLRLASEASQPKVEEKHVPAPIADGRQTVEGRVVSVKLHDGYYGSSLKMTVKVETKDGSWLAWGTCPDVLTDDLSAEELRDCRVRFDAKLKAGRDPHFALFSRPTKAMIVRGGAGVREKLEKVQQELKDCQKWAPADYLAVVQAKERKLREMLPCTRDHRYAAFSNDAG